MVPPTPRSIVEVRSPNGSLYTTILYNEEAIKRKVGGLVRVLSSIGLRDLILP
jgi:hypothetical protein